MTVVILKMHSKQELNHDQTCISPHRVLEIELIVLNLTCAAEHPEAEASEDGP